MAIIFAGNEPDSFTFSSGTGNTSTSTAVFNANFCRCAISVFPGIYAIATLPAAQSSLWFHMDYYGDNSWTANLNILEIRSSTYGVVARLRVTAYETVIAEVYDGAAWISFGTFSPFASFNVVTVDVNLSIAPTGGQASWYVNGGLVGTYTGDTQGFAATTIIDNVRIQNNTSSSDFSWFSQVIVADEDTRGMKVSTLAPNGTGALADWTGTFADVDETTINDSDFISASVADAGELFTMTDLSSTAQNGYEVKAVVQSARASKGLTGPQNLQYYMYSNGTVNASPNITGIVNNFATLPQYVWANDPSTGSPWTIANVNNLQAGFKSIV